MPRYDTYSAEQPSGSLTRGWIISAFTGSLVVHAGLFLFFHFQPVESFSPTELMQPKPEELQRVRLYEVKETKPEVIKATLAEKKPEKKKELTLPKELPRPEEISVAPQHKQLDPTKLFADEKPAIEMAKLETTPRTNPDDLLPKLDESYFSDRTGPKVQARMASEAGRDGDGSSRAIQVAGQDVDGILSGLTAGTGTSRRLSLPGNLTFGYDSADVSGDGRQELEKIAEAFRKFLGEELKRSIFTIEGHTDPTGTPEYNQRLSERRAESVRAWFVANLGLSPENVRTIGYGATRPAEGVSLTGTAEEMQGHRRTEIIVRRPKAQ